nr:MAG: virion morphogenesis family protein [Bacteriophage sp.]UWI36606.1 MAG: virion morphogenesis family protein [Bacteriophage sp.]
MATKSVNRTLDIPSGRLEIYVDKAQQARAEKLIQSVPSILTKSYENGTRKFGEKLLRIVKKCLSTGMPPAGSGVSWPPHAANTVKALGEHTLLNWTGQYKRSVNIYHQRNRTYVGLPNNVKKIRKKGKESGKTLNQIAILLEYGSRDSNLPPRPLWAPAYKAAGGTKVLQKILRNEIRKQLRNHGF